MSRLLAVLERIGAETIHAAQIVVLLACLALAGVFGVILVGPALYCRGTGRPDTAHMLGEWAGAPLDWAGSAIRFLARWAEG